VNASEQSDRKPRRGRKVEQTTDAEAAEFYYAHRNDPDVTESSVEIESPKRLSRVISVRFDPDEAAVIEQRAKDSGLTMSAYVRQTALRRPGLSVSDPAAMERFVEMVIRAVQQMHRADLLDSVANDVAHIRDKIGA